MKFLADENIDRQIVAALRQSGHDVTYVAELDPGITDDQVLDIATREGLLLLTADKDFVQAAPSGPRHRVNPFSRRSCG